MPFPKPPFHTGHRTNEHLGHDTVRKYHRHHPPTPLEKHRIHPPTPSPKSWAEHYTGKRKDHPDGVKRTQSGKHCDNIPLTELN